MSDFMNDVRYALRTLRHNPGFTAIVVLTLALGIGANTAIFSVVRGVLLKALPHRDGDKLVYLQQSADGPGQANLNFSVPEVRDLRTGVPSLAGIAEYSGWGAIMERKDGPVRLTIGLVTGNYFEVMGLSPVLGRVTQPGEDDGPAAAPVAILTYQTWVTRFGSDSSIIGKPITLNGKPVTVIGVLQSAPFFPERIDMLANLVNSAHHVSASMQDGRTHRMTRVVARIRPEASLGQVRNEVGAVYQRLQGQFPEVYNPGDHYRVAVQPFKEALGERAELTLWLLMASAAFVLIVSAANVANLTLMRGVRRDHELVMRAALGAGATQLRRLLLVENLLLALAGAGIGLLVASNGVEMLTAFASRYSSRADEIALDPWVFGFTIVIAIGIAALLSFLSPLPEDRNLGRKILTGATRASAGSARQRVQRGLVVVQIAVSVVLLASAGLLARTMMQLYKVDTGLRTEDVLTMQVSLTATGARGGTPTEATLNRFQQIRDEMLALPGVLDVGIGGTLPLRSSWFFNLIEVAGMPPVPGAPLPRVEFRTANPDYFKAAGIPLLAGRNFTTSDATGGSMIINKALADRYFRGEDPIGRRLAWKADWFPDTLHWQTIIGVVGTTRDGRLDADPPSVVFWPLQLAQISGSTGFVIRADHDAPNVAASATRLVRRLAPNGLIEDVMTVAQFKEQSVAPRRLNAVLISSFSLLAVLIATVGIAGVLAFSVSARTNEIGIRMSLGADGGRVQRMILKEGGALVAVGLVLGIAGAFGATQIMRGLLFGVEPHDAVTFVAVSLTMAVVGLLACWIPALRASRIDPAITMRA